MDNTNNVKNSDEIEIDLRQIFAVLMGKAVVILVAAIIGALAAFVYTKFMVEPTYTSKTQVYVRNSSSNDSQQVSVNDLQSSTYLTKDYLLLCKSSPVLKKVIEELKLDISEDQLAEKIEVTTPEDTRILNISVVDNDPFKAKSIADSVREAAKVQIVEVTGVESVENVDGDNGAELPKYPTGPNTKLNILIGFILGLVISISIIIIRFLLDDTIKTPDDIENYLGLSVLGLIPKTSSPSKKKNAKA